MNHLSGAFTNRWRKAARAALAGIVVWLIFSLLMTLGIHQWGLHHDPQVPADVIVVLGAGVNRDGRAGPALTRRSTLGAELYHADLAPVIVCTGAQPAGRPTTEARACRDVLLRLGVPAGAIVLEEMSRSTEENAIYTQHLARQYLWESAVVVTDSFHAVRSAWLFGARFKQMQLATVAPQESQPAAYLFSLIRETAALQWQFIKGALGLPFTRVPVV
jgi:uncharacterized SAM-binding protein YcdF (DUF218 family)